MENKKNYRIEHGFAPRVIYLYTFLTDKFNILKMLNRFF